MPAKGWIEVSDIYCKGCELCISACPQEIMELDMKRLTPMGYHPAHTFKDGCTGCAMCTGSVYPITPQTETLEYLSKRMPDILTLMRMENIK